MININFVVIKKSIFLQEIKITNTQTGQQITRNFFLLPSHSFHINGFMVKCAEEIHVI